MKIYEYQACQKVNFTGTQESGAEKKQMQVNETVCGAYESSHEEARESLRKVIDGRCQSGELGEPFDFHCEQGTGEGEVVYHTRTIFVPDPQSAFEPGEPKP